jgi:hypothetical protein
MPDYEAIIKAKDETISALTSEVQFLRSLLTKPEKQAAPVEPQAVKYPPIYDDTTKKYREMTADETIEHRAYMQEILGVS